MNPTLRRLLLILCPVAFAITAFFALTNHAMPWPALLGCFALTNHAMPWPALLGCFALMGVLMLAQWFLQTPRQTMRCLAISSFLSARRVVR